DGPASDKVVLATPDPGDVRPVDIIDLRQRYKATHPAQPERDLDLDRAALLRALVAIVAFPDLDVERRLQGNDPEHESDRKIDRIDLFGHREMLCVDDQRRLVERTLTVEIETAVARRFGAGAVGIERADEVWDVGQIGAGRPRE